MTKQEFAVLAAALKTYYSREEKLLPNNQAMELWYGQLKDLPFDVAEVALNVWVAKNRWSPSIADIREMAAEILQGTAPDWGEGWQEVLAAIRRYGYYNAKEAVDSLSGITRECVVRLGFRELCLSETPATDRANFRKLFEELTERRRSTAQLPAEMRKRISGIRAKSLEDGQVELVRIG